LSRLATLHPQASSRSLKKSASGVLAAFRSSTYPGGYGLRSSLAAAVLEGLFERPDALLISTPIEKVPTAYGV